MNFYEWFKKEFGYPAKEAQSPAWVAQLLKAWQAGYDTGFLDGRDTL